MRTAPRKLKVYGQIHQFSSVLFVHTDTKDGPGKRTPATKRWTGKKNSCHKKIFLLLHMDMWLK